MSADADTMNRRQASEALERVASAQMSVSGQLLVACARTRLDSVDVSLLRELARRVDDWAAVIQLARQHGLLPLLHTHLAAVASDIVPDAARVSLRAQFAASSKRNRGLASELIAVVDLLESNGVATIPFKGSTLAQCIYGGLDVRETRNVEILVRRTEVDRAVSLLGRRGYHPMTPTSPTLRWLDLECQCTLARPSDATTIQLHWAIVPRSIAPPIGLKDLSPNRLYTTMLGSTLPSPSHEDMLVILCLHGTKHRWSRLESICSVAELVRSKPVDWLKVLAHAERWRAARMLNTGLLLAADLLGAPVPEPVLSVACEDGAVVRLVRTVLEQLFADRDPTGGARSLRAFQLRGLEGIGDKVRYLWFRPITDGVRGATGFVHWVRQALALSAPHLPR
jgi:Uncharacterised nucleotidyltransferase